MVNFINIMDVFIQSLDLVIVLNLNEGYLPIYIVLVELQQLLSVFIICDFEFYKDY